MGVQPKDLISTLPRLHEKSVVPLSQFPNSPPPPSPPPQDAQKAPGRDRSFTESDAVESDQHHSRIHSETSPPPTANLPTTSLGAKIAKRFNKQRNRSQSASDPLSETHQYLHSRADSATLRRNHYSSLEAAAKCGDKSCRRRFGWRDRKRNCCMCGVVFCRKCTKFMRKLSHNAEPDSLGTFRNVCEKCFNFNPCAGRYRDLKHEFIVFREEVKSEQKSKDAVDFATPIPAKHSSKSKSDQVRVEAERLVKGFEGRKNGIRGLVGTPNWQKSSNWVPDSRANECFQCTKRFRFPIRKINCRICGQVFCNDCTKSEILLYSFRDCPAKWAINGKEGGPTTAPNQFEMYPICKPCCLELEGILLSDLQGPAADVHVQPFQPSCIEEMVTLQAELATMQRNVEQLLPNYQRLVDTLDIEDSSPHSVEEDHPLHKLAKSQADLSDTLSYMASRSQALKNLRSATETQSKLLHHIMMATFNFYQEYMFLFKSTQMRLREMIPIESLAAIQEFLDQQSMERVHLLVQQLSYELLNVQAVYKCDLGFTQFLVQADAAIEEEFRPFLEKRSESWEDYFAHVREFVKQGFKERPYIKLQKHLPHGGANVEAYVQYFTLDRTKSLLSKCVRELDAKTREEAFLRTKTSLANAGKHVSKELKTITDKLYPK